MGEIMREVLHELDNANYDIAQAQHIHSAPTIT